MQSSGIILIKVLNLFRCHLRLHPCWFWLSHWSARFSVARCWQWNPASAALWVCFSTCQYKLVEETSYWNLHSNSFQPFWEYKTWQRHRIWTHVIHTIGWPCLMKFLVWAGFLNSCHIIPFYTSVSTYTNILFRFYRYCTIWQDFG